MLAHVIIRSAYALQIMTCCHLVKGKSIVYSAFVALEDAMADDDPWESKAKRLLRAEMTRRGVTYEDLVEKLRVVGVDEDHETFATR